MTGTHASNRLAPIKVVRVHSATQVKAYIPFTPLPNKWAGRQVTVVPHHADGPLSAGLQDHLRTVLSGVEPEITRRIDLDPEGTRTREDRMRELVIALAEAIEMIGGELGLDLRPGEDQGDEDRLTAVAPTTEVAVQRGVV